MTTKSGIIIIIMPKTKSRIEHICKTKVIYRPKGKYKIIFDIINVVLTTYENVILMNS